jgi:hypothetical protein
MSCDPKCVGTRQVIEMVSPFHMNSEAGAVVLLHLGPGDRGGWVSARRLIIGKARQGGGKDGGGRPGAGVSGTESALEGCTWKHLLLLLLLLASMPYVAESRARGIVSMTSWSRLHSC